MKIVIFENGLYGIRKLTLFGYEYADLKCGLFWWDIDSDHFKDCQGDLDVVEKAYKKLTKRKKDKGRVISDRERIARKI